MFYLRYFSSNNPLYTGKNLFEYGFEFAKKIYLDIVDFGHSGVNDIAVTKNNL
jgi:hypothetical protein